MQLTNKYRPKKMSEVVGQDEVVMALENKSELNDHMLFSGPPGSGKTTVAYILAKKFNLPIFELNASDDRGIDIIRNKVKPLCRSKGKRIIFLDESDQLSFDAMSALRRMMEKTESIFILTGNNTWKIIPAIQSRCAFYEFKPLTSKVILSRLLEICVVENITIDKDAQMGLLELLEQAGGDMRKAINLLSKTVNKDNTITLATVKSFIKPKIARESFKLAIDGRFVEAHKMMEDAYHQSQLNPTYIIKELFESIKEVKDIGIKTKLFRELATTESRCKIQADPVSPLIQLVGFLSFVYLVPHLSTECPVLKGGV